MAQALQMVLVQACGGSGCGARSLCYGTSWRGHSTPTMCLCGGFKDHYGGMHGCVGEHDEGEGETDWSRADTAGRSGEETERKRRGMWAMRLSARDNEKSMQHKTARNKREHSHLCPKLSRTLSAPAGQWQCQHALWSLKSSLNPWFYPAACPNQRFHRTLNLKILLIWYKVLKCISIYHYCLYCLFIDASSMKEYIKNNIYYTRITIHIWKNEINT